MWQQAVIDRIVDGRHAVLLVGEEEVEKVVPRECLPEGSAPGTWLRVRFEGERLVEAVIDEAETERARARVQEKLAALRRRGLRGITGHNPES
mgnify:FL=1